MRRRFFRWLVVALGASLLLLGVLCVRCTADDLINVASAFAPDGRVSFLSTELAESQCERLRAVAWVLLVCAVLILALTPRIVMVLEAGCSRVGEDFLSFKDKGRMESRWAILALLLISLAGAGLRLCFLFDSIQYDEASAFNSLSRRSPAYFLSHYWPMNHVLHTISVYLSYKVLGPEVWVLRLSAFFAGIFTVPLVYACGRLLGQQPAFALLASALVAVSPFHVDYSTMARGYSLQALWVCGQLFGLGLILRGWRSIGWAAVGLASTLGLYTQPTTIYSCVGLGLWAAILGLGAQQKRPWFKSLCLTMLVIGLSTLVLYSPFLIFSPENVLKNYWHASRSQWLAGLGPYLLECLKTLFSGISLYIVAPLLCVSLMGLVLARRQFLWLLLSMFFSVLLITFAQKVLPFCRCWVYCIPFGAILFSVGLEGLSERFLPKGVLRESVLVPVVITLLLINPSFVYLNGTYARMMYRDLEIVANWLVEEAQPHAVIACKSPGWHTMLWYTERRNRRDLVPLAFLELKMIPPEAKSCYFVLVPFFHGPLEVAVVDTGFQKMLQVGEAELILDLEHVQLIYFSMTQRGFGSLE